MDSGPHTRPFVLLPAPCLPSEAVWEEQSPSTSPVDLPDTASLATCVNMHHAVRHAVNHNHGKKGGKDKQTYLVTYCDKIIIFFHITVSSRKEIE